jgi:hypothetical protein
MQFPAPQTKKLLTYGPLFVQGGARNDTLFQQQNNVTDEVSVTRVSAVALGNTIKWHMRHM